MLHKPDFKNIEQALSATRHEIIEAEYAKTQSYYAPPTSYKAQAMEWIESLERDDNDSIFQGYKYANIVIDEESGKTMEYRELLKHPKYKENGQWLDARNTVNFFNALEERMMEQNN